MSSDLLDVSAGGTSALISFSVPRMALASVVSRWSDCFVELPIDCWIRLRMARPEDRTDASVYAISPRPQRFSTPS